MWTEINPLVEGQVLITVFNSIYFILFWLMQWTFFITNGHQVSWKRLLGAEYMQYHSLNPWEYALMIDYREFIPEIAAISLANGPNCNQNDYIVFPFLMCLI